MPGFALPLRTPLILGQTLRPLRCGLTPALGDAPGEPLLLLLLFARRQRACVAPGEHAAEALDDACEPWVAVSPRPPFGWDNSPNSYAAADELPCVMAVFRPASDAVNAACRSAILRSSCTPY